MSSTYGGDRPPDNHGNPPTHWNASPQWSGPWVQQPPQAPPPPTGQRPLGYGPPLTWVAPVPVYPYAHWGRRVGAYLIDFAPSYLAMIPFYVGYVMYIVQLYVTAWDVLDGDQMVTHWFLDDALIWMGVGAALLVPALIWQWYNRWLTAGRTGQSLGKRVLKVKLLAEISGQPIGPTNAFLRDLAHILDGAVYIGYLWPLWDRKRQTFADQIMKTVVTDLRANDTSVFTAAESGRPSSGSRHW